MVVLILYSELDEKKGTKTGRILVSHGVDTYTLETITLPQETPDKMGHYNENMHEWVLNEKTLCSAKL